MKRIGKAFVGSCPPGAEGVFFDTHSIPGKVLPYWVAEGMRKDAYRPAFLDANKYSPEALDVSSLAIEEELAFSEGREFSGIGYAFESQRFPSEFLFEDGFAKSWRIYGGNGFLFSYRDESDLGSETSEFYSSGGLKSELVYGIDIGRWMFSFNEVGEMFFLSMEDVKVGDLEAFKRRFSYFPWSSKEELFRAKIANKFVATTLSLSVDLVREWLHSNAFLGVEQVLFPKDVLFELSEELLRAAPALKTVEVDRPSTDELEKMRALYPNCTILAT